MIEAPAHLLIGEASLGGSPGVVWGDVLSGGTAKITEFDGAITREQQVFNLHTHTHTHM